MSKKIFITGGIIAGIAALNVVGAKVIGSNLENGIKSAVSAYSEQMRIRMEVENFKSEWFSSEFQLKVYVPAAFVEAFNSGEGADIAVSEDGSYGELIFNQTIDHGPIAFTDNGPGIGLAFWNSQSAVTDDLLDNLLVQEGMTAVNKERAEKLRPQLKELLQIELDGNANLLGGVSNLIKFEGGNLNFETDEGDNHFVIKPLNLEWTLNSTYDSSDINLDWSGMEATLPNNSELVVDEVVSNSTIDRVKPEIWLGDSDLTMGSISFSMAEKGDFKFTGLDAKSIIEADTENDSFSMDIEYNTKNFTLTSEAADMNFDGFEMDASISKIKFSLLETILDFSDRMNANQMQDAQEKLLEYMSEVFEIDNYGDINATFVMNGMTADVRAENSGTMKFSPTKAHFNFDSTKRESDFNLNMGGFDFDIPNKVKASLRSITANAHQYEFEKDVWVGNSDFTLSNMNFNGDGNEVVIDKIDFRGVLEPNENQNLDLSFDNLIENFNAKTAQGNIEIISFKTDMDANDIPSDLIRVYQNITDVFNVENMQNQESANERIEAELASISMQPTLKVSALNLVLKNGDFTSNAEVNFTESFTMAREDLMALLNISGEVELSEAFVVDLLNLAALGNQQFAAMTPEQRAAMATGMLQQFVAQGMIAEREGGKYNVTISTINNFIAVNGLQVYPLVAPIMQ